VPGPTLINVDIHFARLGSLGLCLISACSLEVPGTGPDLGIAAFDASIGATGAGTSPVTGDLGQEQTFDASLPIPPSAAGPGDTTDARDAGMAIPSLDAAPIKPAGCSLDGRFALRVTFHVNWVGTQFASIVPVIDQGEGELSFTGLYDLESTRTGLRGTFRTCAAEVPEFVATLSRERYRAHFADAVWDSKAMPTFTTSLSTRCKEPGCGLTAEPLYSLIGAALPSPTAAWPSDPSAGEWPDHDGDGEPGVAVTMLGPELGGYSYPPLDLISFRRVHDLSLGLRVVVALDGALESCDVLRGTGSGSVETRAVSCQALTAQALSAPPSACEPRELSFLNENLPVWTVRQGAFEAKRLAGNADCQSVRAMLGERGKR
jgi:hypothetical protein